MAQRKLRIEVVDDASIEMYRHRNAAERLRVLDQLYLFSRKRTAAGAKQQHPGWTSDQVEREVSRRIADASD